MHVVIVGNGIAGSTVARGVRKRDPHARITLVGAEAAYPWSRPALMYVYMGHLTRAHTELYPTSFWAENRIELVHDEVMRIDVENRRLHFHDRVELTWDRLVLATGSEGRRLGWPGEHLRRVSTLVTAQDLDALEGWTPEIRRGVVVGGGLIGVELAEMLHSRGRAVTLLVRESSYWGSALPAEESAMVGAVIRAAGIDLRFDTELAEILDDGSGCVGAVRTRAGDRVDADYVGLTVGVAPRVAVCTGTPIATARGILVDRTLRTSVPDVYACGDCAEIRSDDGGSRVESVWYTGRMQGDVVAANVTGADVAYDPGIWFNSAKFFDVEHQVYGRVPSAANPDPRVASIFWRDDAGRRSVRLCHVDGALIGVASLGVRLRHRVCEAWIAARAPVDVVLGRLEEAAFDPEFSRRFAPAVRAAARA